MIQNKLIDTFKDTFTKCDTVLSAIMYGSFARKQANTNSDIDLVILKTPDFIVLNFLQELKKIYQQYKIIDILYIKLRNKSVIYFEELPKIEITFVDDIKEIERNYKGSLIQKKHNEDTILFDKTNKVKSVLINWEKEKNIASVNELAKDLINKFIYEFESASSSHSRSDGYKFYYFYNIALHCAVQLKYLAQGKTDYYFLPKRMSSEIITNKEKQDEFYKLSGSNYLPNANDKKRKLLDFFYEALIELDYKQFDDVKNTLEQIYKRDFLWNFRDLSKHINSIKPKEIFRTSTLTNFQNEGFLLQLLKQNKITTIIDLRANHEIEKNPYKKEFISNFKYVRAHFDPWKQPEWFKRDLDDDLTNEDKAYYFFLKACKNEIKHVFETILNNNGATAIHCVAGKDRTGLVAMLIAMLSNASYNELLNDYLATEVDTTERKFKIYYNYIIDFGGINKYLKSCEISDNQIKELKNKLTK